MKGIWAAAMNPFKDDFSFNEEGLRRNIRHWIDDLGIQPGCSSPASRGSSSPCRWRSASGTSRSRWKRPPARPAPSCRARTRTSTPWWSSRGHAEAVGADYIVVHAPVLHFVTDRDDAVYQLLQGGVRPRGHRHRHVEPSGLGLPDEPGAVRTGGGASQHRRHQVLRAPAHVRGPDKAGPGTGSSSAPPPKRSGSTTSWSWAGSSTSAPRRRTCCRPGTTGACTSTPSSPWTDKADKARQVRDSLNPVREALSPTPAPAASPTPTRNTGRSSWARPAGRYPPAVPAAHGRGEGAHTGGVRGVRVAGVSGTLHERPPGGCHPRRLGR